MSYSKAFSGGLFLSVGILHLLPEVIILNKANEKISQYYEYQIKNF